jgi:hypothetical protein
MRSIAETTWVPAVPGATASPSLDDAISRSFFRSSLAVDFLVPLHAANAIVAVPINRKVLRTAPPGCDAGTSHQADAGTLLH